MTARRHQIVALSAAVLFLAATTTAAIASPIPAATAIRAVKVVMRHRRSHHR